MKAEVLLVVGILAVAATTAVPSLRPRTHELAEMRGGTLLEGEVLRGETCRILVEADADTVVDRGTLRALRARQTLEGTIRYQEEPLGRVLYVYDDVQNLVGRIVNPRAVRILEARGSHR